MFLTQDDIQKKVNDRIKEVLLGIPINFASRLPCDWYTYATKAIRHKSARDLGLTGEEYDKMVDILQEEKVVDCYTFAGLNNEIEDRTPLQLGLEYQLKEYARVISDCQSLVFLWEDQTKEIRQKTINAVMEEQMKKNKPGPINGRELSPNDSN